MRFLFLMATRSAHLIKQSAILILWLLTGNETHSEIRVRRKTSVKNRLKSIVPTASVASYGFVAVSDTIFFTVENERIVPST